MHGHDRWTGRWLGTSSEVTCHALAALSGGGCEDGVCDLCDSKWLPPQPWLKVAWTLPTGREAGTRAKKEGRPVWKEWDTAALWLPRIFTWTFVTVFIGCTFGCICTFWEHSVCLHFHIFAFLRVFPYYYASPRFPYIFTRFEEKCTRCVHLYFWGLLARVAKLFVAWSSILTTYTQIILLIVGANVCRLCLKSSLRDVHFWLVKNNGCLNEHQCCLSYRHNKKLYCIFSKMIFLLTWWENLCQPMKAKSELNKRLLYKK